MCANLYDGRDYEDIFGILFTTQYRLCESLVALRFSGCDNLYKCENTNTDLNLFHSKTYNPIGPISSPISYGTAIVFSLQPKDRTFTVQQLELKLRSPPVKLIRYKLYQFEKFKSQDHHSRTLHIMVSSTWCTPKFLEPFKVATLSCKRLQVLPIDYDYYRMVHTI